MNEIYANIIVNISHSDLDRYFQYRVPEQLIENIDLGSVVKIPFGKSNRVINGYVIGLTKHVEIEESRVKDIISVVKSEITIEAQLIKLAFWIKSQYGSTMINALKTVIPMSKPIKQIIERKIYRTTDCDILLREYTALQGKKNAAARLRFLEQLLDNEVIDYNCVVKDYKISPSLISKYEQMGYIKVTYQDLYRDAFKIEDSENEEIIMSKEQSDIVENIVEAYKQGNNKVHLIRGVTGSGKTLIYIEVIKRIVDMGKQAIVLIPEISLTYQTVRRFNARFGNRVTVMHSRLSAGERSDQYLKAKRGEIDVIIGPRSALFAPFANLGIIIIDEEHEASYKSEQTPKYHSREVAIKRAELCNAMVVLGSATPSLESYERAVTGEYVLHELDYRATRQGLPKVEVVDMREELMHGNRTMLSRELRSLIEDRLNKKEQIMLFINRRGYASFVSCRSCGNAIKCEHCDVTMTYHRDGRLVCHYCGATKMVPKLCPSCNSKYIAEFGIGTEKVEDYISKEFPSARTIRMDYDTTSKKDSYYNLLSAFRSGEADILIGTQMIVKGHDFPRVTLVGVIAADLSLFNNDFRAGEKTFQLLTQVIGRCGRGEIAGNAVIQTYKPEHYAIALSKIQDYKSFYEEEMAYRDVLKYPPVHNMLVIFIIDKEEQKLIRDSELIKELIIKGIGEELTLLGPTQASISKINDYYRRVIYIKERDYSKLVEIKDFIEGYLEHSENKYNIHLQFDFNPMIAY